VQVCKDYATKIRLFFCAYVDVRHNFEKKIVNCSQIWDTHIAYNLKLRFRSDVHGLIRR
jgi:hypothetical protein